MKLSSWTWSPPAIVAITLVFCLGVLSVYVPRTLLGEFDRHVLPSKMFGVPEEIKRHGFTELYAQHESGWDGQFYYYISNDIFAEKDTTEHIDAPAYRYQRIGLPLAANLVAQAFGREWVSPTTYYLTSLTLILIATFLTASFFKENGINPLWAAVWSLGYGTQITLLNGLPDGAADALLIIATISIIRKHLLIYTIVMTFAVLSREAYVLFPLILAIYAWSNRIRHSGLTWHGVKECALPHLPAIVVFLGWQLYLRHRFGISPSSQAHGILDIPFITTIKYIYEGLQGHHPFVPSGPASYKETALLISYALLLIFAFAATYSSLRRRPFSATTPQDVNFIGYQLSILTLIGLYTAFGPTVIMHHTGYLKAANIFLFTIPFTLAFTNKKLPNWPAWVMIFIAIIAMKSRVIAEPNFGILTSPTDPAALSKSEPKCLSHPMASLKLDERNPPWQVLPKNIWTHWMNASPEMYSIIISNDSSEIFHPYHGKGSVNLSYKWVKDDSSNFSEGSRTLLSAPLGPGEKTVGNIVVTPPRKSGKYILRFTLVQEGCFWFDEKSSTGVLEINKTVYQ